MPACLRPLRRCLVWMQKEKPDRFFAKIGHVPSPARIWLRILPDEHLGTDADPRQHGPFTDVQISQNYSDDGALPFLVSARWHRRLFQK